jgi:hypothetical protein
MASNGRIIIEGLIGKCAEERGSEISHAEKP